MPLKKESTIETKKTDSNILAILQLYNTYKISKLDIALHFFKNFQTLLSQACKLQNDYGTCYS